MHLTLVLFLITVVGGQLGCEPLVIDGITYNFSVLSSQTPYTAASSDARFLYYFNICGSLSNEIPGYPSSSLKQPCEEDYTSYQIDTKSWGGPICWDLAHAPFVVSHEGKDSFSITSENDRCCSCSGGSELRVVALHLSCNPTALVPIVVGPVTSPPFKVCHYDIYMESSYVCSSCRACVHGTCTTGTCKCNEGHTGVNCSQCLPGFCGDPCIKLAASVKSTPALCGGRSDGSVSVKLSNVHQPSIQWTQEPSGNFIGNTEEVTGLLTGRYKMVAYDLLCGNSVTEYINIEEATRVVLNNKTTPTTCFGDSDGILSVSFSGPHDEEYSWYLWEGEQWKFVGNGDTISSLPSGQYYADSNGCKPIKFFTEVANPPEMQAHASLKCHNEKSSLCNITINMSGGHNVIVRYAQDPMPDTGGIVGEANITQGMNKIPGLTRMRYSLSIRDLVCTDAAPLQLYVDNVYCELPMCGDAYIFFFIIPIVLVGLLLLGTLILYRYHKRYRKLEES